MTIGFSNSILKMLNRFSNLETGEPNMKKSKWIILTLVAALALSLFTGCGSTAQETKFSVEYMDGDAVLKTEEVAEGGLAAEWTPEKEGQTFLGWFATPTKSVEFDFSKPITENTKVFAGFSVYAEDSRSWAIVGSGKGDLLLSSNWGKVITDAHKLEKTGDNEYSITLDLYAGDEFQFAINTEWHHKRGFGYLETATDEAGSEVFTGAGGIGETAAKGQNIKVAQDGNYTLTLYTHPGDDYYDESNASYSEANKEVFNLNDYDKITWTRNGDAGELSGVVTNYYIKGANITLWADLYNDATGLSKAGELHTLTIYLRQGEEFMFTSLVTENGQSSVGSEYIRFENLDEESQKLFTGSGNIVAAKSGTYTFTYDESTKVLSATLDNEEPLAACDYYIDGNFEGHSWNDTYYDPDFKFSALGEDLYELKEVKLDAGAEFIIQSFEKDAATGGKLGAYNFKYYRGDGSFTAASPENSNYNLKVARSGLYNIQFNAYAKVIEITPAGQEDTVHIKGSFVDSWNIIDPNTNLPSDDYKLTNNGGLYEITMTITEDMVANGANWQAGLMVNTTTGTDGEWIGISCLGADAADNVNALFRPASGNNLTCTTAGTYRITFDLATKTINIYQA